jgi:pyruvate formate lyase activating enzyme
MATAVYTNIQRYSLHDGPGLRTILFLKGCPLSCLWCSNPETQKPEPELMYTPAQCIACGTCADVCKYGAFVRRDGGVELDKDKCIDCGACAEACPSGAAVMIGTEVTAEEAADLLEADAPFFRRSGGGVTVSGGEPSMHPEFTDELIRELKLRGIHTAVESCGQAPWEDLRRTVGNTDLVLYDLKIADPEKLAAMAGADSGLVFENARKLSGLKEIVFRVPVIPGYTDGTENLAALADFVASLDRPGGGTGGGSKIEAPRVHLLPYHSFGSSKYTAIGMIYELGDLTAPSDEEMESYRKIFEDRKVPARIV